MRLQQVHSRDERTNNLVSIDLLRAFMRSDDVPKEWSIEDAQNAIERYERFLLLAAKHKHIPHAPTRDIDVVWHLHMLHPRAYLSDCMSIFGEIFDHDGGFGKGEGELPRLINVFSTTSKLWESEYGEPYLRANQDAVITKCWHDCQGRCWHACASISQNS